MAIAGFVTGLLGCLGVLGIVFGFIALKQIGDRGGKGRGLAIAGIVLSCLWIVGGGALYALRDGSDSGSSADGGRTPGVSASKTKEVDVAKMKVGDCINDNSGATTATEAPVEVESVKVVPCTGPHDGEVLAVFKLPGGMLPSENQLNQLASTGCKQRTESRINRDPAASSLTTSYYYPTLESWTSGDRDVTCVAVSATEGKKLTRPLRG